MSGQDQLVHRLALSGNIQDLKALLNRNPQLALAKGSFDRIPLHCAAAGGAVECVRLLIEHMTRLQTKSWFELLLVRSSSQPTVVDAPDNLHAWTPLFEAVLHDSLDCAKLLLEHGANPNAKSTRDNRQETPLFHTISLEMLLLLKEYGANLDVISAENQYAFEATAWHSLELLQFWLNQGVNVNHVPGFRSPLLHTVIGLYTPGRSAFFETGCVNQLDSDGKTIAHPGWVNLLLDYGADPNLADRSESNTPLHIAILAKQSHITRLLLDRGANPNAQNYIGDTPLHQATKNGEIELSQLLIQYGADVNLRNLLRRSAWDNAQESPELLAVLVPHWLNLPNLRPTPQQLIERILAIPKFRETGLTPCSEEEIAHLEQKFGVILPETYKYFLRILGKWAGGNDHWLFSYMHLEDNMAQSEEYAEEIKEYAQESVDLPPLPECYFIFASRLASINLFFIADGTNNDPPIYYFGDEREHNMEKWYDSFWDWLEERVIYYEYYNQKGYV